MTKLFDNIAQFVTFVLGPILFALLVLGGLALVFWGKGKFHLSFTDWLGAVGAGAGLLAVGHGLHHVARSQEQARP